MLHTPTLSQTQIDSFHRDGFVLMRGGFNVHEQALLKAWATELAEWPETVGRHWVYREASQLDPEQRLISRIENIAAHHQGFATLCEVLKTPVAQLLGEPAAVFKEKVNYKMPGGDGFKPHQDSQAGWEAYADYFISAMVCIDEATIENGCLEIAAGCNRRGLYTEWEPLTEEQMADMDFQPCTTSPGDIVLFDSYTPHASKPNLTSAMRRMYFATYNRLSEGEHLQAYYADKRKSYPPDIEREAGREYVFRV